MMYSKSIAPEDFSISSVKAMIAASGGGTFAMVVYEKALDGTLMRTFCTLRW